MSHTWHWHTHQEHPYLVTSLLEPWSHGFFSRDSWPSPPEELSQQLNAEAAVYRPQQVHGKQVADPSAFSKGMAKKASVDPGPPRPEADAIVTTGSRQAVWVCTADCTPALIGDGVTGQAAAVHAGWRGTALAILPETVKRMQAAGSLRQNLRVALGPAIAGEVYQVSTSVAVEVGKSLFPEIADEAALLDHLQALDPSPLLPDDTPGRVRLDVRRVNERQLLQMGLQPEHIEIAPHCTYQDPARFFSYRRTREKKVQWSGIVSA